MSAPVPLELATRLHAEVNEFARSITHLGKYDKFTVARLLRECDLLAKTNATLASVERAVIYSTVGQPEEFERWARNLEQLKEFNEARLVRFSHLINYGYASKALAIAEEVFAHPAGRNLMFIVNCVAAAGGFQTAATAIEDSIKNQIVLQQTTSLNSLRNTASVLKELKVSDEQLALMLDVAGEMLRKHSLYWQDTAPQILGVQNPDGAPYFSLNYRVAIDSDEAAAMTWQLTEALIDRGLEREGVYIGFQGTLVPELEVA